MGYHDGSPCGDNGRVDVTLAYYLFLAHFALLKAPSNWKCFYLSAVLLGFAVGVKHTALIYALALCPLIVWAAFTKKQSFGASVHSLFSFSVLALLGSLPWLTKNWLLFHAPLYPFLAQRRVDSWLAFIYPENTFPLSLNPKIWTMLGEVRAPFNLVDPVFKPAFPDGGAGGSFLSHESALLVSGFLGHLLPEG